MKSRMKRLSALCVAVILCFSSVSVAYAQEPTGGDSAVLNTEEAYTDSENLTEGSLDDQTVAEGEENQEVQAGQDQNGDMNEADNTAPDESGESADLPDSEVPEESETGSVNEIQNVDEPDSNTENIQSVENTEDAAQSLEKTDEPGIVYEVHSQYYGWMDPVSNGETAGTMKESKRLEALKINLKGIEGTVNYQVHSQYYGWMDPVKNGEQAGKTGEAKRIEAVKIWLDGQAANEYDIYYTLHIQDYGWLKWTKGAQDDSGISGSTGMELRAEAIKIQLVKKDGPAPADIAGCANYNYVSKYTLGDIMYSGHQEYVGDLDTVYDGAMLGSVGSSRRLESIVVEKGAALRKLDGDVEYRVHVEDYGTDKSWHKSGQRAGTTHEGKRLEALQMRLTGEIAEQYDIYYRVHAQEVGWMKWTKGAEGTDEESGWTGSEGLGFRIEAVQIKVVPNGEAVSDSAKYQFLTKKDMGSISYSGHQEYYGNLSSVADGTTLGRTGVSKRMEALTVQYNKAAVSGTVQYRAHVQDIGWQSWVSAGQLAGTTGRSKRMEAVQIRLTGELGLYCDVWYRVHVQDYGWLGWAKNGQTAGTSGISYRIEAVQIKLVPKGLEAPGANSGYYKNTPAMSAVDQRIYNYCQSVYNSVGRDLRSCYNWVVNNMRYQSLGVPSLPSGYTSRSQWYAIKAFSEHRGNCYCYAAAFYYLAKNLGYNAEYVEGRVTAAGGGYTPHGWVVINGAYICDPEAQDEIGRYNFYMQPIGSPVLSYIR